MTYLEATHESGKFFYLKEHAGSIIMLNLLKFKEKADYSNYQALKQEENVSGRQAYKLYMEHTLPILKASGGEILFQGESNRFLIGPEDKSWDLVLLVKHKDKATFLSFAKNEVYLKCIGHRQAALEDSRLLPIKSIDSF